VLRQWIAWRDGLADLRGLNVALARESWVLAFVGVAAVVAAGLRGRARGAVAVLGRGGAVAVGADRAVVVKWLSIHFLKNVHSVSPQSSVSRGIEQRSCRKGACACKCFVVAAIPQTVQVHAADNTHHARRLRHGGVHHTRHACPRLLLRAEDICRIDTQSYVACAQ
jgi:hypothetical protein